MSSGQGVSLRDALGIRTHEAGLNDKSDRYLGSWSSERPRTTEADTSWKLWEVLHLRLLRADLLKRRHAIVMSSSEGRVSSFAAQT